MSPASDGGLRGIWFEGVSLDCVVVGCTLGDEFATGAGVVRHPEIIAAHMTIKMMNVRDSCVLLTSGQTVL